MASDSNPTVKILKKAKKLIADPQHWTRGASARNAQGRGVIWNNPGAVSFCSIGALHHAAGPVKKDWRAVDRAFLMLKRAAETRDIADFNDDPKTTHTDVMVAFDKAIRMAKEEAKV
jgi:hypothetical protein